MRQLMDVLDAVKNVAKLREEVAKLKAENKCKEQIIRKQAKAIQELAGTSDKERVKYVGR